MQPRRMILIAIIGWLTSPSLGFATDWGLKEGTPTIKAISTLAFGPDGILLIGDAQSATIFAIDTGDTKKGSAKERLDVGGLSGKIGTLTGNHAPGQASITDLAVNPLTGNVFVAITPPAVVRVDSEGILTRIPLQKILYQQFELPNIPQELRQNLRRASRGEYLTDLAYVDGRVFVSSQFSITAYPFPFPTADRVSVAHHKFEADSLLQSFTTANVNGNKSLLAGFDCTFLDGFDRMPLVQFPIGSLKPGSISRGTTVAELTFPVTFGRTLAISGERSKARDMFVYQKQEKSFLLVSNSDNCLNRVRIDDLANNETSAGGGRATPSIETIKELTGKTKIERFNLLQMDRLNETHAVVLLQWGFGGDQLCAVELP